MGAMYNDGILTCLLDQACVDQLGHQVSCERTSLHVLRQRHYLLLEGLDLCILGLLLFFLFGSSLLVSLHLCMSPAPLAGDLQHVG